jgi:hypothetical protein
MCYDYLKNNPKEILLIKLTALFWIIAKLMSWKLWLSDRLLPIIPPFDFSPNLPNEVHFILFLVSIFGLVSIVIFSPKKEIVLLVLITELASCFLDQMRWQPWEYQYLLLFLFYIFYKKNTNQLLELVTLLIGLTYIYSGLHKFNGGFLYSVWENMILKKFFNIENYYISKIWIHYAGLLLPFIETLIGISLLLIQNKRLIAYFAIGMHVILLIILIGNNQNSIVWPWNILMILYILILFWDDNSIRIKMSFFKNNFNVAIVFLVGILPFLSFFGLWDNYLSFNLYSGNVKQLSICIRDTAKHPELKPYISNKKKSLYCQNYQVINLNYWAFKELNVPIYPEEKCFHKLKQRWKTTYPDMENSFICYWYPYKKENYKEIQ